MKKLLLILLCLPLIFTTCKKEDDVPVPVKKTYILNFEARHYVSQYNQFADPYAFYGWSVDDEDYENSKYDNSGYVIEDIVTGSTTAQTGDWIFIYISVNDVFCNGSVSCNSTDGDISLYAFTDNSFLNESVGEQARVSINGKDTIIPVKAQKFQIR